MAAEAWKAAVAARNAGRMNARRSRARALQRGEAAPLLDPETRTLALDAQTAIDAFLAERGATKCESAYHPVPAPPLPRKTIRKPTRKEIVEAKARKMAEHYEAAKVKRAARRTAAE
jgi:hypothetical protein